MAVLFWSIAISEHDRLYNFTFENFMVKSRDAAIDKTLVNGFTLKNMNVNQKIVE